MRAAQEPKTILFVLYPDITLPASLDRCVADS
jgi:hypothetical protein